MSAPEIRRRLVRRLAGFAVVAIALLLFAVFLWPTRYRDIAIRGPAWALAARQNRLTGNVEFLMRDGYWRRPTPTPTAQQRDAAAMDSILAEIRRQRADSLRAVGRYSPDNPFVQRSQGQAKDPLDAAWEAAQRRRSEVP
jgi:hypothetical protein